jgi:hypothetical protein
MQSPTVLGRRDAAQRRLLMTHAAMQWSRSALLVLAAVCAACGDDDDGNSPVGTDRDPFNNAPGGGTAGGGWGPGPSWGQSGNGSSTGGSGSGNCASGIARTSRVTPRVILVLDGSCSMSTNYPSNGDESASECTSNPNGRWAALRNALIDPQLGVVPQLQHLVQFGLVVFGTNGTCPIPEGHTPVRPAMNNLGPVTMNMPQVQPGMYTPTGPALEWVYENMIEEYSPDGENGPQIVILATDG